LLKKYLLSKLGAAGGAFGAAALVAVSTLAAPVTTGYSLFGDAEYVSPGAGGSLRAVQLQADLLEDEAAVCGHPLGCGGIEFTVVGGTTFADLTVLSSDFNPTDDGCVGGSPRFQIAVEDPGSGDSGNISLYFGVDSAGAPCVLNTWQNTGDMLQTGRLVDTSQLDLGAFYDPYDDALVRYGDYLVTGISIVVDSGWASADEQTALIDNTMINEVLYDYEPTNEELKAQCKKGGWMTMTDADGNSFKNQGDCVSHFATGGKNPGAGE
jgi:hypothetical protein